jgi:hypothetical protein
MSKNSHRTISLAHATVQAVTWSMMFLQGMTKSGNNVGMETLMKILGRHERLFN